MKSEAIPGELSRRPVVESVSPEVDSGRYPIKRTRGEEVRVTAQIFADGHDVFQARLRFRRRGERA